jgi:hypothetical protein
VPDTAGGAEAGWDADPLDAGAGADGMAGMAGAGGGPGPATVGAGAGAGAGWTEEPASRDRGCDVEPGLPGDVPDPDLDPDAEACGPAPGAPGAPDDPR